MGDSVELMFSQLNVRVHTAKADMTAIVFTGSCRVEQLIVLRYHSFTAARVFPNPILERILDRLLFLLGEGGFLFIQDTLLLTVRIFDSIIDTNIFQVQRFLQDTVGIGTVSTVGRVRSHIVVARRTLSVDSPFCGHFRELDLDGTTEVIRGIKGLLHELLDIARVNPGRTQTHINFRRIQVFRLCLFQSLHIDSKGRITVHCHLSDTQLASDITGKVFIGSLPACGFIIWSHRVFEDNPTQFRLDCIVLVRSAKQIRHIRQIYLATLTNGDCQSFRRGIHAGHSAFRFNGSLGEHIGFAFQVAVLVHIFQRTQEIVRGVVRKCLTVGTVIDKTVLCGKNIIGSVQLSLLALNHIVREVLKLVLNQLIDDTAKLDHAGHTLFCLVIQVNMTHDGVFTEINVTIYHSIGEVLYIRTGRNGLLTQP